MRTRTSLLIFSTTVLVLLGTFRAPAPIVEESTPPPTATVKPAPPPPQSESKQPSKPEVSLSDLVDGDSGEQTEKRSKKSKSKPKPERTTTATKSAPASPTAPSAAPVASRGFAGTWKGTLTDGIDWVVIINPTETAATVRSSLGSTGGPTRVDGGALWWNCKPPGRSSLAKQNIPWSMRLMGGRRAEVIAHQASGNNFGVMEKLD